MGEAGRFTAHKARAGNRRGGGYWRAYRRQRGQLLRAYLGVSANLTLPVLDEVTRHLAARAEPPAESLAVGTAAAGGERPKEFERTGMPASPLLRTKCTLPRLPVQHVPRPHLVAILERDVSAAPLTLISAPAGSGKTTLLAEWARATHMPVAWLSLEAAESDPTRLLAYLLAALNILDNRIGQGTQALWDNHPDAGVEGLLSQLVNDLSTCLAVDCALVLDDAHALVGEAAYAPLHFFLEHLPERLHLLLGTRVEPLLPLARLRARSHLSELRSEDLRFVPPEVRALVRNMELDLDEKALSVLEQRTDGWVAGVQLAALALRGRNDKAEVLDRFHGNHRFVSEYIGAEILSRQPHALRSFLLQTSVLERLSASLCDAVTGGSGSQVILEKLRKANLFVSALDDTGDWYCYHALFAEGLCHQLQQQAPEWLPIACSRASAWYESRGLLFEACEYALKAGDYTCAARLIDRQMSELIGQAQFSILQSWLTQIPPDLVASHPLLGVASSWVLLVADEESPQLSELLAELQQRLHARTGAAPDQAEWTLAYAHVNFMRVLQALGRNDAVTAVEVARQTLATVPEESASLHGLALICQGLAEGAFLRMSGDYAAAERVLIATGIQPQATNYHFLNLAAVGFLSEMYEAQGALPKLARLQQELLNMARAHGEASAELFLWSYLIDAKLLLEWNRLDEAEEAVRRVLGADQMRQILELSWGSRFIQVWISQARHQEAESSLLMRQLEQDLSVRSLLGFEARGRVGLWLSQGRVDQAVRWLEASGLRYDDAVIGPSVNDFFFPKYLMVARVLIADGRRSPSGAQLGQALALLERLVATYEKTVSTGRLVEALILASLAWEAQDRIHLALPALGRALALAEPSGYVRLFANEGEAMARLLAQVSPYTAASVGYQQTLRAALESSPVAPPPQPQTVAGPLSRREREVLSLLAGGASNQLIADSLVISLNTAKKHVKHVLAKLAAGNRTQAVARAREYNLL